MPDLEAVKRRIREHRGPADESHVLDVLEWSLREGVVSDKLDDVADRIASIQEGNPQLLAEGAFRDRVTRHGARKKTTRGGGSRSCDGAHRLRGGSRGQAAAR